MTARAYTLALEGATYEGSVALIRDGDVVCERTLHAADGGTPRAGRGERLMPAIASVFRKRTSGTEGRRYRASCAARDRAASPACASRVRWPRAWRPATASISTRSHRSRSA